jgi:hypothetical protein
VKEAGGRTQRRVTHASSWGEENEERREVSRE